MVTISAMLSNCGYIAISKFPFRNLFIYIAAVQLYICMYKYVHICTSIYTTYIYNNVSISLFQSLLICKQNSS